MSIESDKEKEEYIRILREDPILYINKHIKVVHPIKGLVPFELYPFQKKIVNHVMENRFNILCKFRQAGCTTIAASLALHMTTLFNNKTVVILSKDDEAAMEVLERVKIAFNELPGIIKPKKVYSNSHMLKFDNGSVVRAKAPSKEAGRSISANLLILDEAAFIDNVEYIYKAAYPTISTGGSVFILSTVNGMGNWFHNKWVGAESGESEYKPILIHWRDHPEYKRHPEYAELYEYLENLDPPINVDDWERITRSNVSDKEWLQEYECSFLGTGDTYISGDILRNLKESTDGKQFTRKYNNRMRVWQEPKANCEYILSADVALGRGRDYSAFHIINVYTGEQVAEFYSNKTPLDEFAKIINMEGKNYNLAYTFIERNTLGIPLVERLFNELSYENLWMDEKGLLGYQVTTKNREILLANMEEKLRSNRIKINSERAVSELLTFVISDSGKIMADEGCNDDLVMSLALGCFALNELTSGTPLDAEINKEYTEALTPSMTKYRMNSFGEEEVEEDITWLIK